MERTRFIEVDLLRTIAILLMVIYHIGYDLSYFHNWNIDTNSGGWWLMGRSAANLFLLLVGISFILSAKSRTSRKIWKHTLRRSAIILGWAYVITLTTYVIDSETYIRFGILHCIGVSILLLPVFHYFKEWNMLAGIVIIAGGMYVRSMEAASPFLLPLGIKYHSFVTLDYFPILPWLGVILIGMGLGHFIFIRCNAKPILQNRQWKYLILPGKHSLLLYLIHQPLLILLLWALL